MGVVGDCQQAADKLLKAYLAGNKQLYPVTHDLFLILEKILPLRGDAEQLRDALAIVMPYAVDAIQMIGLCPLIRTRKKREMQQARSYNGLKMPSLKFSKAPRPANQLSGCRSSQQGCNTSGKSPATEYCPERMECKNARLTVVCANLCSRPAGEIVEVKKQPRQIPLS